MSDKLIRVDQERGKAIFLRTFVDENGNPCEKEIELDLPEQPMAEGVLKRIGFDDEGKMHETEEVIRFPMFVPLTDADETE